MFARSHVPTLHSLVVDPAMSQEDRCVPCWHLKTMPGWIAATVTTVMFACYDWFASSRHGSGAHCGDHVGIPTCVECRNARSHAQRVHADSQPMTMVHMINVHQDLNMQR